jgi:hypothetical protein
VAGGVLPFSLLYVPGKNAIIASDPGVGYDIFNLDTNETVSLPIPGQTLTCWSVYSKESGNFYMVDVGVSTITEVHVTGSLNSSILKASLHSMLFRIFLRPLSCFPSAIPPMAGGFRLWGWS